MRKLTRKSPSPALIVACAALVMAMTGAAVALPGKGKVKANDIAKGAVKSKAIAKGAVKSKQVKGKSLKGNRLKDATIKDKQIADATITGAKVAENGLDSSNIGDYKVSGMIRVAATDGADADAARTAAPETPIFEKGDLDLYAKCYRDTGAGEIFGGIFIRTKTAGAIVDGPSTVLEGGPTAADFLNPDTLEEDREVAGESTTGSVSFTNGDNDVFRAFAPDDTALTGAVAVAVKQGDLAAGNGVYGAGNVCLFDAQVSG